MRRGKNYRLNIMLSQRHTLPGWTPADPERIATDRALQEIERTWVAVVAEQEGQTPGFVRASLPSVPRMHRGFYATRQYLVDTGLAGMSEAETHAFAEDMAKDGVGAISASELNETMAGNTLTLYPNRWLRVSDEVFQQYGCLEDRRPYREAV